MGESGPAPTARLPGHTQTAGNCLAGRCRGTARSAVAVLGSVPGACRAVLPLLSSGLDVLGWLWGRQGQGEAIYTVCKMDAGTYIRAAGLEQSN